MLGDGMMKLSVRYLLYDLRYCLYWTHPNKEVFLIISREEPFTNVYLFQNIN